MCYSAIIKQKSKALGIDLDLRSDKEHTDLFNFHAANEPLKFKVASENGRIFPYYFAPVLIQKNGYYQFVPMRYQLFPATYTEDPKHLTLFNARKDTLLKSNIWNRLLGKQQGMVFMDSFFEWVQVRDLLKAGIVTLKEIENKFKEQELAKKKAALKIGKKYRPSKTALTSPVERKIEIFFKPNLPKTILAPVIYDIHMQGDFPLYSFAILTDLPLPEVEAAGHDRSPIFLQQDAALQWLNPTHLDKQACLKILESTETVEYGHSILSESA